MDATRLQPLETPNDRCRTSQQFGLQIPDETTTNIGSRSNRHEMHPVLGLLKLFRAAKSLGFEIARLRRYDGNHDSDLWS